MSKGPGRVQLAVAAELAKLRDYHWDMRSVEDLCMAVFGECDKKHRVSVLRALPYALAQNPHLELHRSGGGLWVRINYHKRRAWRQRLMREGAW